MTDRLWNDLNNLLTHLRDFDVVDRVETHYALYNNNAPGQLLRHDIARLQQHLDNNREFKDTPR